jgi:hypothetical protein
MGFFCNAKTPHIKKAADKSKTMNLFFSEMEINFSTIMVTNQCISVLSIDVVAKLSDLVNETSTKSI